MASIRTKSGKGNATHTVALDRIRLDEELQPRAVIDNDVVREYAASMEEGDTFPPVVVFFDGLIYWLADGFHRTKAAIKLKWPAIDAIVHQGDKKDAILYSVGANASHGVRRSNADKRAAVMKLLADPEWSRWSNSMIAERCRISETTVNKYRNWPGVASGGEHSRITSNGNVRLVSARPAVSAATPILTPLPPTPLTKGQVKELFAERAFRELRKLDSDTARNVDFGYGVADIVTSRAIYFFTGAIHDVYSIFSAIGKATIARQCLGPHSRIYIAGQFVPQIKSVMEKAAEAGFQFVSPESVIKGECL